MNGRACRRVSRRRRVRRRVAPRSVAYRRSFASGWGKSDVALLDLSNVTKVLVRLLQEAVTISPAWSGAAPAVSPLPPDKLAEAGDLLGLYLYHVSEDPYFRNAPAAGHGPPPVALTPLGLVLHYQLTAHTNASIDAPDGAYTAQLLFGLAMKALHDFPSIADSTVINGVNLLAAYGLEARQNRLRLVLRPVAVENAVQYWTAGQGPARLAAYYECSVVMLEPERAPSRPPLIIEREVSVLASGPPQLTGSRNTLSIMPPGASEPRLVVVSPAQVAYGARFTLLGSDLVGESTELLIEGAAWGAPEAADAVSWELLVTPSEVSATVQHHIGARAVVPGVYSVTAQVRRAGTARDPRERVQRSNRTAILIAPEISAPVAAAAGASVLITGSLFDDPAIPDDSDDDRAVQIFVGSELLVRNSTGPLAAGEFEVTDAHTLTLRLPLDLSPGFLPLRVRVNGAESPPRWLEVTA